LSVVEVTAEGLEMLKHRKHVTLTRPVSAPQPQAHRAGEIACDEILFERLRQLRKRLADERSLPPYIIFSDVSLRQMARLYPSNDAGFARISGVGERKLRDFGAVFMAEIATYLKTNPRQIFADDSFVEAAPIPGRTVLGDSARETLRRFRAGQTVEQIAAERGLVASTIYGHLADALLAGEMIELSQFLTAEEQGEITAAFRKAGSVNLSPVFELLGGRYDYGRLKLVRAALSAEPPRGAHT
jgi:ATP-dependent DNA helicase RecQ